MTVINIPAQPESIGNSFIDGGTPGSVLFIDSNQDLGQDNSNFFWDATNHRLGIGTTAPAALLDVSTGTTAIGIVSFNQASADTDCFDLFISKTRGTIASPTVITTGDEMGMISFRGYSGAGGYVAGAGIKGVSEGTVATTRVPGHLSFWTGTNAAPTVMTERMRIDSAGLVGVATTSPAARLQIGTTAISASAWTTSGIGFRVDAASYTDTSSSGVVAANAVHAIAAPTLLASSSTTYTASSTLYIAAAPTASTNVTQTNAYSLWAAAGNVRFDSNLGLAVAAPAARLHLGTTAVSAAAWTTSGIGIRVDAATYTDSTSSGTVNFNCIHALATPVMAASSSTTYTLAATLYIPGPPTAGSNVTITNPYAIYIGAGAIQHVSTASTSVWGLTTSSSGTLASNIVMRVGVSALTNGFVVQQNSGSDMIYYCSTAGANNTGYFGVGTTVPLARIHTAGNLSAAAWTTNGIIWRVDSATYTDTSSSGTVTSCYLNMFNQPTLAASSATTYTVAATFVISNSPAAGSNATISNSYALYVPNGVSRFDAQVGIGNGSTATAWVHVGGNSASRSAWTTNGTILRVSGGTLTDTSSSGTVAGQTGSAYAAPIFAASSTTTYTSASTLYISGAPTAGTNVTLTKAHALWIAGGTARLDGGIIGTTTNDSATAGNLGEEIKGSLVRSSANGLANTTTENIDSATTLSLTAGDWDVSAMVGFIAATATVTQLDCGVATTSATLSGTDTIAVPTTNQVRVTDVFSITLTSVEKLYTIPSFRVTLSATTSIYLVAQATFSAGTVSCYGSIRARRIR